jgi:hypothetical protein
VSSPDDHSAPADRSVDAKADLDVDVDRDDDLDEFVRGQQRAGVHPVRVVLAVFALLAVAWVLVPTRDELAYSFTRQAEPLVVGDVVGVDLTKIPDNTWVRASVVLGNKAAEIPEWRTGSLRFGPIEVREVVGAPLFVEVDRAHFVDVTAFSQLELEGRLVSFGADSELAAVRGYFEHDLHTAVPPHARALVLGETPTTMGTYLGAWIGGVALVVLSLSSVLRRLRRR